jgi:hypothetical protein
MKNLFFYSVLALMLFSCEKPPTIEEAKQESYDHLVNGGLTDILFVDDVEPTCDPVFRYRFSFVGKQEGDNIKGCICWTKPTRIFIHIYERQTNEQP